MAAHDTPVPDDWRETSTGRYLDGRVKSLILDLTAPRAGERVLDVGCGGGEHLSLFRKKGCDVTGIDPSPPLLDAARQRLEHRAELRLGRAEDLPFSDNEFDIVTLISSLEFTDDPGRAVAEAIRVCRGRMFIGVMNRYSLLGAQGHLARLSGPPPLPRGGRSFHLASLTAMIRAQLQGVRIHWGSVVFLPWSWYAFGVGLEERIPVMNNPFGAFFGLAFPMTFTFQTIQHPVREEVVLNPNGGRPMPGVVRGLTGAQGARVQRLVPPRVSPRQAGGVRTGGGRPGGACPKVPLPGDGAA